MTVITVRFIASRGFISRAIMWVTGSLFSHVEFGTPEGTWIGAHYQDGLQERPADYCKPLREYVYDIPCTKGQLLALMDRERGRLGTKYNLADICGLLFHLRRLTAPAFVICLQEVTNGLLFTFGAAKVLNTLSNWTYRITPETLHLSPIFVGRRRLP